MNPDVLEVFKFQCHFFQMHQDQTYLYEFDETSGQIRLKNLIKRIVAKCFAFFSKSYSFRERDKLKNRLITFYLAKEPVSPSIPVPVEPPKSFFKKVTVFFNKIKVKNEKILPKKNGDEPPQVSIKSIIDEFFPEFETTKKINDFFKTLNAEGYFPSNIEMEEVFCNDKKFSKEVVIPLIAQMIIDNHKTAHNLLLLTKRVKAQVNTFSELKKNCNHLNFYATLACFRLGKKNLFEAKINAIQIVETPIDTLKKIEDLVIFINETFPQAKLNINSTEIEKKITELKTSRDQIIATKPIPKKLDRTYDRSLLESEKKDINFIVTTLKEKNGVSLAFHTYALKEAGNRIKHIHPLNFLVYVLTTPELKSDMKAIKGKQLVWDSFFNGIKTIIEEEKKINNLTDDQIRSFAKTVNADPSQLIPYVQNEKWDEFILSLLKN